MQALQLTELLHQTIPITNMMEIEVSSIKQNQLLVEMPIIPNINIHGTGFAGSLYTLCTIACWCSAYNICQQQNFQTDYIVLKHADIDYQQPVTSDMVVASCQWTEATEQKLIKSLQRHGLGKISLNSQIMNNNDIQQVNFIGEFGAKLAD